MHILHEEIGAPHITLENKGKTSATMTISPLPTGFGHTLGNAIRRVLFGSLPGTAVSGYKIEGVTHEYTAIEGIKESVFDIGLNLRELRLKKNSKGIEMVELPLKKSGVVTAADLKVTSDIEILEPSQVILTCDGYKAKGKCFIQVEKGVGTRIVSTVDSKASEDPELILLDSVFSPLVGAKYAVEPARVGDRTNLDKLVIEAETTGAIDAESALKFSGGMLMSYFALIGNEDAYSEQEFTTSFDQIKKQKEAEEIAQAQTAETSFTPVDILGLSQRTLNALVNGGITSVEQLLSTSMTQLLQLRGFGQKAKNELEEILAERGYALHAPK